MRTWNEALRTGNGLIDRQHETVCDVLDDLEGTEVLSDGRIAVAMLRLRSHFTTHFLDEELLMEQVRYPESALAEHRREHVRFFDVWTHYSARVARGGEPELREFVKRLRAWVEYHLKEEDQKVTRWIKEGVLS
jgi:hemerythrin-like metal-binding protein